jgi:hypothetical protein
MSTDATKPSWMSAQIPSGSPRRFIGWFLAALLLELGLPI